MLALGFDWNAGYFRLGISVPTLWHAVNGSCHYMKMGVPSGPLSLPQLPSLSPLVKELSFSSSSEKHFSNMWLHVPVLLSSCLGVYSVVLGFHCIENCSESGTMSQFPKVPGTWT